MHAAKRLGVTSEQRELRSYLVAKAQIWAEACVGEVLPVAIIKAVSIVTNTHAQQQPLGQPITILDVETEHTALLLIQIAIAGRA